MKNGIIIFSVLLFLWIAGSSYCYVCEIRKNCGDSDSIGVSDMVSEESLAETAEFDKAGEAKAEDEMVLATPPQPHVFYFNPGQTACGLTQEDREKMEAIKSFLSENMGRKLIVTGHSDKTGSADRNAFVSKQRAEFIRQELLNFGINAEAIEVYWKSFDEPVADNDSAEGRAKNRRTEIKIN
jgi:outer membrane protein OmpA-like peptidoglycan-associated protein